MWDNIHWYRDFLSPKTAPAALLSYMGCGHGYVVHPFSGGEHIPLTTGTFTQAGLVDGPYKTFQIGGPGKAGPQPQDVLCGWRHLPAGRIGQAV